MLQDAHHRGENIGAIDVLERYQEWRRFDVNLLALATDGFNKLFSNSNALLRLDVRLVLGLSIRCQKCAEVLSEKPQAWHKRPAVFDALGCVINRTRLIYQHDGNAITYGKGKFCLF